MKARVIKIDELKSSRNPGQFFQRIYFELEDGSWAATDVVQQFRNYKKWKPVIDSGVDTLIEGVELKSAAKVDADSPVRIQNGLFKPI